MGRTIESMKWFSASVALLVVASAATAASAQSLAEVARQEEARRKAIKSSGKVYTNANIRPEPPPSAPPAPIPSAVPAVAAAEADPAQTTPPVDPAAAPAPLAAAGGAAVPAAGQEARRDEAYWRARLQTTRDALARAETFAEALQSRINALSTDFVNRDDPAQRSVIGANRDKALAELERVRREIQDFTKAIAAIQDEARRAGVPAGWVR